MSRHSDQSKELARMVRMEVREDSDQPGRFVWVELDSTGAVIGGCDASFESQDEAWDEVIASVVGETMAHFDLSDEQWDAMDFQAQQNLVRRGLLED